MSQPGSAGDSLASRGAEFYAAVIVIGFCSGVMTGLMGVGSGLTFVCGWNVSFLIYEAALGSSTRNKNPFAEYDDLVGIMVVCEIFVNSYSALLHRHKVWSLRRLIPCLMLPSLCLCPVGAWVYAISDITTVRALIAHLLFWFAFGWLCLHPPSREMNPVSGKMQSIQEDESGGTATTRTSTAIRTPGGGAIAPRATSSEVIEGDVAEAEVDQDVGGESISKHDEDASSSARLEETACTPSTVASTRSSATEAEASILNMNLAMPPEPPLPAGGERQKHSFAFDEHLLPNVREETATAVVVKQVAGSRPPSVDSGTALAEMSDAVVVPRYVYFGVVCAACGSGFFGGLMGLTGPPLILLGLVLPPSLYPASVARALSVLGLSVEPYARAFYVRDKIDFGQCGLVYASALLAGVLGVCFGTRIAGCISERIFRLILCGLLTGTSLVILGIFEGNELALAMLGLLVLGAGAMHVIGRRKCRAGGSMPRLRLGEGRCWRKKHIDVAP